MNKTIDYHMFSFVKTNRPIVKGLVNRLKESITDIGYIDAKGILVNEKLEILDGQHRFTACKELGIPVTYFVLNKKDNKHSSNEIMVKLNEVQAVWRLGEYIAHFAKMGNPKFIEIEEFEKRHHLGISNNIIICLGGQERDDPKNIRSGKIERPLFVERDNVAVYLKSMNELPFWRTFKFVAAVIILFKKADQKDREKLHANQLKIPQCGTQSQYLSVFENIINKNKRNGSQISLQ